MNAQPLLFDELPETERVRRPARRSRATTLAAPVAADVVREAVPAPMPRHLVAVQPDLGALAPAARPAAVPEPFDPASLSNAELRALVQALPDQRLAHLLLETARELKRRVVPDHHGGGGAGGEDEEGVAFEPDQTLLRAARQAAGLLSGEDD